VLAAFTTRPKTKALKSKHLIVKHNPCEAIANLPPVVKESEGGYG